MKTARLLGKASLAFFALFPPCAFAQAPGVVFTNSDPLVVIHSTFTGRTVTFFGNIEIDPASPNDGDDAPYDVIVTVRGPTSNRIVHSRERLYGIYLDAQSASYRVVPGFYAVLSSRPVEDLLPSYEASSPQFSLIGMAASMRVQPGREIFDAELVRLMGQDDRFQASDRAVTLLSPTAFSARVSLPSNVPNGLYTAEAFVISGGQIVTTTTTSFIVRTEGFERFIARSARSSPTLYGIATVLLALVTGWAAGIVFRR